MFIYFPEFAYRKTKEIVKNTFNTFDEKYTKEEISRIFSKSDFETKLKTIKENKISLPTLEIKHCIKLGVNSSLEPISKYNLIDNKIEICGNLLNKNFSENFIKEFSYFYNINIVYSEKDLSINDITHIVIDSCKNSLSEINLSKNLKEELTKRCSYVELKYKFHKEILDKYPEYDNNTLKKLIEQNYISY